MKNEQLKITAGYVIGTIGIILVSIGFGFPLLAAFGIALIWMGLYFYL